ncbi:rhamnulokinase [Streptomyces tsukubensis]|nr:rhamnulokinase [Streptomyces tsukubensis]
MVGRAGPAELALTEVHRFPNRPVALPDGLHWDVLGLYQGVLDGLGHAARSAGIASDGIASVGIDSWAVDYGLLDAEGTLLGNPYHYRDGRTEGVADRLHRALPAGEHYGITGLQRLPFNTVFQLAAAAGGTQLAAARTLLMIPDLLTYWLTGTVGAESTNASTTGLFDARAGTWSDAVLDRLGIERALLPALRHPGDNAGTLLPGVVSATGLPASTPVTAVASHDTASAVAAVPATGDGFAYISCGTWSLAGLELDAPVISEASRAADFTNERGVEGTFRFLRNVMGLWLLSETLRRWAGDGLPTELAPLLEQAARARPFAALVDPDDPAFLSPGDIPARIAAYCARTGQTPPQDRGATVRCVLESLALAHRATLRTAAELSGRDIRVVHMVGGGSRNELLCQLTSDATGLPVVAGPAEATALGNVLVQARSLGVVGERADMRRLVAATQPLRHYRPAGDESAWSAAARRVGLD